jgi:subtilisin family serine protease
MASLLLAAPQQSLAQQPAAAPSALHRVTLITGDRVMASGPGLESIRIERAPGREGMSFTLQRLPVGPGKTHLFVFPADAAPLLQSGKVDRRLFDVTLLVESGYDDARRNNLPLIVTYPRSNAARALPRGVPGTVAGRDLPSVNGQALSSPKAQVSQVWRAVVAAPGVFAAVNEPIDKIWLDALHHPVLDHSTAQIGAPAAWELGYEGDGVVVAVLDTGVDEAHPDLIDTVVVSENFTVDPDGDQVGHGTHVASIIAGSGAASDGLYRGVAPGVSLLSGKVCEGFGCPESSMIAGMQWAAAEEGAQVINMSISGTDTPGLDPLEETVETLSSQFGTLFVISAGNDGGFNPVGTAGSTAAALTVGAVDREDNLADFSSRGLTLDGTLKPDITGPGVDIVAARGAGTELGALVGEDYVAIGGTSMAAPHVAGAAALVLQQHPTWRGADVKAALMGSAAYNPIYTTADQGAGRVDVAAALDTSFLANASSLSLGIARWPHEDDAPTVRTVTYRNLGPATELELELDIVAADGTRPPAEMFTVTPSSISLPEGGTASVRVTANTSVPAPDGLYSGRVLASDASGRSLAIPLALVREVESYDLTLRHLDRQGEPTAQWFASLFTYGVGRGIPRVEPPSTIPQDVVLRLPKGRYAFESYIVTDEAPAFLLARMLAPNQVLDADKLLVLDASAAVPIDLISPAEGAENLGTVETWGAQAEGGGILGGLISATTGNIAFYRGEIDPPEATLLSEIGTEWVVSTTSPPEYYAGAWTEKGRLPTSRLEIDIERAGVVNAHYSAPLTSLELEYEITAPMYGIPELGLGTFAHEYELPLTRTERYFSPDPAMRWVNDLWMHNAEFTQSIILGWVPYGYPAGETSSASWNEPVFSPSLPEESLLGDWGSRDGDVLTFNLPMYGDRGGHGGFTGAEGTSKLHRDGELVGQYEFPDGGQYEVGPEPATYRLELDHRQSLVELTPHQQVAWTFASGHVEDGSPVTVPLLAVRFTPELDEQGRAPSGTHFCVPLSVDQFDRDAPPEVSTPTVEASYDDGATWAAARVEPNGSGWNAFLDHPRRADYVSLRTSTHDASGNAVEQTIYRAYGLKKRH